jgi:sulfur carrier protein
MLKINGQDVDAAGKTLESYITEAGFNKVRIAVERNGEIVPKSKYGETVLADGDCVEVVNFVGGG